MSPSLRNQSHLGKETDGFWGELKEPVHGAGGGRGKQEGIPAPKREV